ncbi:MAG: formylglycine-generating enzyme family protein [Deltaproteobacteria bacterium]
MNEDRLNPLDDGVPPEWASSWGQDRQGVWVGFEIGGVEHILRWIPRGEFMMGSANDEPGRFDNEGPQHRVTITRGFWLGQTPCTQALWQAVMGSNPSRFVDPQRPVENVSWDDANAFLTKASARVPGLRLPTEAEWEYACRANMKVPPYDGPIELLGDNNAPMLDLFAWYGGNSGDGYKLEEAHDSSSWPEKQHPHARAGTRRVKTRRCNAFGLHDMLGNVFEWCADGADWNELDPYPEGARHDPVAPAGKRPARVMRGGSWDAYARGVRAASRYADPRGVRVESVGFRLARGRALEGQ